MAPFVPYHTSAGQSTIVKFGGLLTTEFLEPPPGRCFLFRQTYKRDLAGPIPSNLRLLIDSPHRPKGPLLHFHQFQTEYFRVEQGLMGIEVDGVTRKVTSDDGEISVKAGSIHQFFLHPESPGDMTVYLSASDAGMDFQLDRVFFENWYGYWHDALLHEGGLSLLQYLAIQDGGDAYTPAPWWVPFRRTVGYWSCVILGRWIGGMLGYRPFFKEYTTDWEYAIAKMRGSFFQRHLVEGSFAVAKSWPEQMRLGSGGKPLNAEYEVWTGQLHQDGDIGNDVKPKLNGMVDDETSKKDFSNAENYRINVVATFRCGIDRRAKMSLVVETVSHNESRALTKCAVLGALLFIVYKIATIGARGRKLPPGPKTTPILGNEHQIPAADGHFLLTDWARAFGGIFSLKRFTNTTLVVSDRKLIKELLDKRSNIFSNRPASNVAQLITQGDHLLIMNYGKRWQMIRKLVHQYFMEPMCEKQHVHVQHAEATQMMRDFLLDPENHMSHPKRYSNSITNSLVFGIRTKTINSEYMNRLYALMEKWSLILELGATPQVDSFPLLKWIPQRFLGNWRSRAEEVGGLMTSLYSEVLGDVEKRREKGINRDSFMDRVLNEQDKTQLSRNELYFLGGVLMEGGSDTSSSLILAILLAMMAYPHVQKRAQAEIDAAIGEDRSPQWSDFSKLPYINMIIKESHRWRPVSPLGVPHALAEDCEIEGMHLPKDATVVLNVWGMHHDPSTWKDPEHFMPERFESYPALASTYAASGKWDERDHYGYGAGRRICPGMHLAERNLFIGVAKLLWAFRFEVKRGDDINVSAETGLSQGFLHCVKDYGSSITVRSNMRRETILREFEETKEVFERFETMV